MDTYNDADKLTKGMTELLFQQSDRHEDYHTDCLAEYYDAYPDDEQEAAGPASKKAKKITVSGRHSQ
jgi:hypothetical protein